MIEICNKDMCTGCGLCVSICTHHAIAMQTDVLCNGHIFPKIDTAKCVDCGLCVMKCPQNQLVEKKIPIHTYAAWNKDYNIHWQCTSGGLAFTLSRYVIEREHGVVYASVVDYNPLIVHHVRIDNLQHLEDSKCSKYVQSAINSMLFRQIKNDLKEGRKVLFTGTPCQVDAVRSATAGLDTDKLILVDIICHGVPSLKSLKDYIGQEKRKQSIKKLSFRGNGGGHMGLKINDKLIVIKGCWYYIGFLKGLYYRPSCYQCQYADRHRISDVTLGDFWGLGKLKKMDNFQRKDGVNVVLVNSKKGQKYIDAISTFIDFEERSLDEAVSGNRQLRFASKRHFCYNLFKILYPKIGFINAARISLFLDRIFYSVFVPLMAKIKK